MRYLALDFETANSSPCSACSVGLSVFEDGTLVGSKVWLLKPPEEYGKFHWYNIKVHGIRKQMVVHAPTFATIWNELQTLFEGSVIVCHNAMFDTSVLCKTLEYYGMSLPRCRYICTVKVSQKVWPALENHKLNTVSQALGITLNHHEAGSDALACGLILQKAMEQLECHDAEELAQKLGMQLGQIAPEGCMGCSTAKKSQKKRMKKYNV